MKKVSIDKEGNVKQTLFPLSVFWTILLSLLLMSGVHTALYLVLSRSDIAPILETHIILGYWLIVAVGLTLFIRHQMKLAYEIPLKKLSEATKKVAKGDFSVYIAPIHTPDKLDYLDVMIMDMNTMIEELGSIETLKTDFISNVSHEMKTPLAAIKNYAELLQNPDLGEERRLEYTASIKDSASRMSDLISNILKLNKLENQRILPEPAVYDVARQLIDCILAFETAWDEKEIDLDVDIEEKAYILADESLLTLVWNNLLSNAVKFTEPGGSISIRQITKDGQVIITIADSGCGMSPETVEHIFDKFYQGDTSHSTEGNGLGLALVHRVLTLLQGEIKVESKEGQGSIFTILFPSAEHTTENTENAYE